MMQGQKETRGEAEMTTLTDAGGNKVFAVAQQLRFGFEVHAFRDREHFQAWAKAHQPRKLVDLSAARGKPVSRNPVDHRFDDEA